MHAWVFFAILGILYAHNYCMKKLLKSFGWAMHGIASVWREEVNFRIQSVVALLVVGIGVYLGFTILEWIIIAACITSVLSAEILNTAIEDLCNKVEPQTDPAIGKIKDMMGGFVLLVALTAGVIGLLVIVGSYLNFVV